MHMPRALRTPPLFLIAAALALGQDAPPKAAHKAPTPADWAALGKLPDFTGVWEIPLGGPARGASATPARGPAAPGPARGRGPAPQAALTPEYAAKAQELAKAAAKAEDN